MRVIAIDGPAGSGKSTVSRALAARLGLALRPAANFGQDTGRGAQVYLGGMQQWRALAVQQARPSQVLVPGLWILGWNPDSLALG